MSDSQEFSTVDWNLVAYLIAMGEQHADTDASDPERIEFIFRPAPDPDLVLAYMQGQARVDIKAFVRAQHEVKRIIWGHRNQRGGRR